MNHYERLGLTPSATDEELRHAIAQQAAQWSKRVTMAASLEKRHEAERALQAVQEARVILLDAELRATYDAGLLESCGSPGTPTDRRCAFCAEPIPQTEASCPWCHEATDGMAGIGLPSGVPTRELAPTPAPTMPQASRATPFWQKAALAMVIGLAGGAAFVSTRPKEPPYRYDFRQLMVNEAERGMGTARPGDAWVIPAAFPEWVTPDGRPTALQRQRQAAGYGMPEVWGHLTGTYVQPGHQEDLFLFAFDDPTTAHPENWHRYYVAVFEDGRKVAGPMEAPTMDGLIQNVRFPTSRVDCVLTRVHGMHQGFLGVAATVARVEGGRWKTVVDLGMVGSDDWGHYGDARATLMAATIAHVPDSMPPRFRIDEYTAPGGAPAEKTTFRLTATRFAPAPQPSSSH